MIPFTARLWAAHGDAARSWSLRWLLAIMLPGHIVAAAVPVVVRTVEEGVIAGDLLSFTFSEGASVRGIDGAERRIPTRDLVRITTAKPTAGKNIDAHWVTLAGGDNLRGRVIRTEGDSLLLETADLETISLPMDAIAEITAARAAAPGFDESAERLQRGKASREDQVLLTNGDVIRGFVNAIQEEHTAIETGGAETKVPTQLIVSIRFAITELPPLSNAYLTATIGSTGRVTLTDLVWTDRHADARLRVGGPVRVDANRITRVDLLGGRWEWLSDHVPISVEQTPMLSLDWPNVPNRNVRGRPLRVAGEQFERGIGVHSRSHLTFDLHGGYREFVTSFGMDDDSGALADVAVSIRIDGRTRFDQSGVRRGKLHGPVRLDVRGANRIELVVEFGKNGDVQDRFNWVESALIRE